VKSVVKWIGCYCGIQIQWSLAKDTKGTKVRTRQIILIREEAYLLVIRKNKNGRQSRPLIAAFVRKECLVAALFWRDKYFFER
jgi:hypothetical protein